MQSVRDSGLLREWPGDLPALRAAVYAETSASAATPAQWGKESCNVVAAPGTYPEDHTMGPEYSTRLAPILIERLAAAGQRLAAALNGALASP